MRADKLRRVGAARSLAALFARADPDVAALSCIDAGDALSTATRFDREWAYRGGQALFWKRTCRAHAVHDLYLPAPALRPFDRRGLLRIDAECAGAPLHLFATQFAADRSAVRDLRFARAAIRGVAAAAVLLFVSDPGSSRIGFGDLGLQTLAPLPDLAISARGFHLECSDASDAQEALSAVALVRAVKA